jgi:hypothetical protein
MQLRPDLRIQSSIDAMTNVVIPAIDPDNGLAQEQAQLVVGMLGLLAQWLPLEYRYDRDELARLLRAADKLNGGLKGGDRTTEARDQLAALASEGHDVLERAGAEPLELQDAVRALRAGLGELVGAVFEDGEAQSRDAASHAVLELSSEQIPRVRAAYAGQGFEGDAHGLPPLEQLLAEAS